MGFSALVVDDDEFIRQVTARQLMTLGASHVASASDGEEAARVVRENGPFDVILLDLMMPGSDGVQFLRYLADTRCPADLIITSSADRKLLDTVESLAHAHSLSVLGVLAKPARSEAIRDLMARHRRPAARSQPVEAVSAERLAAAVASGHIVPYFQPKLCARTGALRAVEALARWEDAAEGLILPARFIAVAEGDELIDEMTLRISARSFEVLRHWESQGLRLDLAINLSAHSLDRIDLPDRMMALASHHGVAPERVTFEITESVLIGRVTRSLDSLIRLRLKGFHLAIDDFGTGYSTLTQLKLLPLSELKIDQSFVARSTVDPEARAIVESCVGLAQQIGLASVAEGVGDEATATLLRDLGTTLLQGYLYSRPLPHDQMLRWGLDHQRH